MQNSDFLEKFIVPLHIGKQNTGILFEIQDLNQNILLCSHKYANLYDFSSADQLIGLTPKDRVTNLAPHDIQFITDTKQNIIQKHQAIDHLYIRHDKLIQTTNTPIFNHEQECIGFELNSRIINTTNKETIHKHMLDSNCKILTTSSQRFPIDLNKREEIIIQMLIERYTQQDIASYFKISRSTVSSIIVILNTKFGIIGSSAKDLTDKAVSLGFSSFYSLNF